MTERPVSTSPAGLPQSPVIAAAWDHLKSVLHPAVFNHSVRTYVYAHEISTQPDEPSVDAETLLLACLFHDSGTANQYNGDQRFEVESADAAARFLVQHRWAEESTHSVWEAIALHTSPQIAERIAPLARHTRLGVRIDFGDTALLPSSARPALVPATEHDYARQDIEQVLANLVVAQALGQPVKAPASSWPAGLLEAHLENTDYLGLNPAF